MKNSCINNTSQTKNTQLIIKELYKEIFDSYNYLLHMKQLKNNNIYKINIKKISNVSHISRPKNFNSDSFPEEVRKNIDELSLFEIIYTFSLFDRKITLHFIVEDP